MKEKKNIGLIIVVVLLSLAVAGLLVWNYLQRIELVEMEEQMAIEKEELEEEYEDLALQFDGYQQMDIRNDSLQDLLSQEQKRVQDLLEELRNTKSSNARRINELKKELATVREVMKDYVRQIDSLNATNARLTVENEQLVQHNEQLTTSNQELTQANTELTETVKRAEMLEINACTLTTLNKNDHKTRMAANISKLQFDFVIARNITCPPGMKELYARIVDPDGNLIGEAEDKRFPYENEEIPYTLVQQLEYTGEAYEGVCYCDLGEEYEVLKGFYAIDFFIDGNLIGSFPFQLKK